MSQPDSLPATRSDAMAVAEANDERLIRLEFDHGITLNEAYFYRIEDKKTGELSPPHLSVLGTRYLILALAIKHPVKIVRSECELVKYEEGKPETWMYEATVEIVNERLGYNSEGRATSPYRPDYNHFNRRSAWSKAWRNAANHQIPVQEVERFYEEVTRGVGDKGTHRVKVIGHGGQARPLPQGGTPPVEGADKKASPAQIKYLMDLGCKMPESELREHSMAAACVLIDRYKAERDAQKGEGSG